MRIGRGKRHNARALEASGQNQTAQGATVSADTGRLPLPKRLVRMSRRRKAIAFLVVLIVVVGGGVALMLRPSKPVVNDAEYQKSKKKLLDLSEKTTHQAANNKAVESIPELEAYLATPDLADDLKKDALTQLATAHHNAKQYDKALETYEKLRQLEAKDTTTTAAGKAMTYHAKGDKQNAIAAYQQAAELAEKQKSTLEKGDGALITLQQQIVGYQIAIKSLQGAK